MEFLRSRFLLLSKTSIQPSKYLAAFFPDTSARWVYSCCWILLLCTATAQATVPDSLGIKWGLMLSEFRQMDFDIEDEWTIWHRATAVRLGDQAQAQTHAGSLILVFDEELGLVKTHWAGHPIERDPTGAKGMRSFDDLKETIVKEYGPPQETHEEPSVRLQGFHGDFYQCLQDETCGKWESIWETPEGGLIILEVVGLDAGIGFVQMTHQGPNLAETIQRSHLGIISKEHEI